jgi:hypothetical protein
MIHRGIVVVHGVGEQQRADQLDQVTEQIVSFLNRGLGHANVRLVARTHRDGGATSSATVHVTPPNGAEPEEWHIREAWWGQHFKPSHTSTAVAWALRAFFHHLIASLRYLVIRNLLRALGSLLPPAWRVRLPMEMRAEPQGVGVWEVPQAGSTLFYLLDAVNWYFIAICFQLGMMLALAVMMLPVQMLIFLPLGLVKPDNAERFRRSLVNIVTGYIGDQHAMSDRHIDIGAAANTISTALYPFLHSGNLEERGVTYDTVTLIAHSSGALISYAALTSGEVTSWVAHHPDRRVNFITVGSGLNLAWRMRALRKSRDRFFWSRRIDDHTNWIDIYARSDPVTHGPAPQQLVEAIAGPAWGRRNGRPRPYVSVRVANTDWPFMDHKSYWTNREEVLARIIHVISDSRLSVLGLDPDDGTPARDAQLRPHPLAPATGRALQLGRHRRRLVTAALSLRLAIGSSICAILVVQSAGVTDLGRWIVGRQRSFHGQDWLPDRLQKWFDKLIPNSILLFDLKQHEQAWLAGAVAIGIVLLAASLVFRRFLEAIKWFADEQDDPPPPPYTPAISVVEEGVLACPPGSIAADPTLGGEVRLTVQAATDGVDTSGRIQITLPGGHRFRAARIDRVESAAGAGHAHVEGLLMDGTMALRAFRLEFKTNGGLLVDLTIHKYETPGTDLLVHVTSAPLTPLP